MIHRFTHSLQGVVEDPALVLLYRKVPIIADLLFDCCPVGKSNPAPSAHKWAGSLAGNPISLWVVLPLLLDTGGGKVKTLQSNSNTKQGSKSNIHNGF